MSTDKDKLEDDFCRTLASETTLKHQLDSLKNEYSQVAARKETLIDFLKCLLNQRQFNENNASVFLFEPLFIRNFRHMSIVDLLFLVSIKKNIDDIEIKKLRDAEKELNMKLIDKNSVLQQQADTIRNDTFAPFVRFFLIFHVHTSDYFIIDSFLPSIFFRAGFLFNFG